MAVRTLILTALLLAACGEAGPSDQEVAAKELDRACGRLYSSMTKVYQDELYKGGVADVKFADKDAFVKDCAAAGFTEEQRKCLDPNLGGGEECKKAIEPVADKAKALTEMLLAPMKAAPEEEAKPADAAE